MDRLKRNEYQRKYYKKRMNTDIEFAKKERLRQKLKQRKRYKDNPKREIEIAKRYYNKHKNNIYFKLKNQERSKKYYENNKIKCYKRNRKWAQNNPEKMKAYKRKWNNSEKGLGIRREWRKENPSSNNHYPDNIRNAMNLARKRDDNKCKWYGCKNNKYNSSIHAHHIFPKSEYPDLADKFEYIICYCENHHKLWHRKRWESNRTPRFMTLEESIKARKVYINHV